MAGATDPKRAGAKPRTTARPSPAGPRTASRKAVEAAPEERAAPAAETATATEPAAVEAVARPEAAAVTRPELAAAAVPASKATAAEARHGAAAVEAPAAPAVTAAPGPAPVARPAEGWFAAPVWPPRSLVEGTLGMQGEIVAFACRQTECNLAAGRAMAASRSLPEIVSLQGEFVGKSLENAFTHTRALTRLSAELLREGLRSSGLR